jgi:cholesterol transport system auxiliary component
MLTQLIVSRLERGGDFRAVVATPNSATGELRLDTELLRLQHDFTIQPSRVRITMRAYLVDNRTRQVLAWKEIDETVIAGSGDAYGGVVAANKAVNAMLAGLSAFCADGAARWEQTESLVPGAPRAR